MNQSDESEQAEFEGEEDVGCEKAQEAQQKSGVIGHVAVFDRFYGVVLNSGVILGAAFGALIWARGDSLSPPVLHSFGVWGSLTVAGFGLNS